MESESDGERPSRVVSNRKSGKSAREFGPPWSFLRKLKNGAKKSFRMDSKIASRSWATSMSVGGRQLGRVINQNPVSHRPLNLTRWLWLYVDKCYANPMPWIWRSFASFSMDLHLHDSKYHFDPNSNMEIKGLKCGLPGPKNKKLVIPDTWIILRGTFSLNSFNF